MWNLEFVNNICIASRILIYGWNIRILIIGEYCLISIIVDAYRELMDMEFGFMAFPVTTI
jgi:hypothetical protein